MYQVLIAPLIEGLFFLRFCVEYISILCAEIRTDIAGPVSLIAGLSTVCLCFCVSMSVSLSVFVWVWVRIFVCVCVSVSVSVFISLSLSQTENSVTIPVRYREHQRCDRYRYQCTSYGCLPPSC
jgi:hypothetical protein